MADQPAQRGYDPAEESGWGSPMPAEYGSLTTFLPPLDDSPAPPADQGDRPGPGGERSGEGPASARRSERTPERPPAARRSDRRWWTRRSAGPDDAAQHSPNGVSPPASSPDPVWAPPAGAGDGRGDRGATATPAAGSAAVAGHAGDNGGGPGSGRSGGASAAAGAAGAAAGLAAAHAMGTAGAPVQPYGAGTADTRAVPAQPDGAGRNRGDRAPGPPPITRDPLRGPATTIMPIPVPLAAPIQQQTAPDEAAPEQTRASLGSRRQQRKAARPKWAQSKRTVRHLNVWTVFKVSLAFYVIVAVAVVVAAVMLWYVADALGSIQTIEKSVKTLFDLSKFTIHPSQVAKYTAIGGGVLAVCGTFANVLAAFTYNLISDLVGGIRFDVVDEGR